MKRTGFLPAILAALLLAFGVLAQEQQQGQQEQPQGQPGQQVQQQGQADQLFVTAATQSNMYEIEAARLALERATNEDVRAFAQRMVDDHTAAGEQMSQIATDMGLQPPTDMGAAHQLKLAYLQVQEGADFDRRYMEQQILAHQDAVALFQMGGETVQDQQLRDFVLNTLPLLQEHLELAQQLGQQTGQAAQ